MLFGPCASISIQTFVVPRSNSKDEEVIDQFIHGDFFTQVKIEKEVVEGLVRSSFK
jgi:hypothetical protein